MCSEKYESVDVKYHSTVAFLSFCLKLPKKDNFGPIFKGFFSGNITFWQIEGAEVKHDNTFFKFWHKNSKIRYFQCKSSFYLHEALYELKFTSLKTKLLPNISKLCCYFPFPVLNKKTNFFFKKNHISCVYYLLSQRFLYLMTVKLPKVRNNLLEEMNPQRNCTVSKNTYFQQIFMGAEKKIKEIFRR